MKKDSILPPANWVTRNDHFAPAEAGRARRVKVRMTLEDEIKHTRQKLELAKLRKELTSLKKPLEEMRPVVWTGSQIDLGRWILRAYGRAQINASSARQAVEQTVKHFRIDGHRVNFQSLDTELRKEKAYDKYDQQHTQKTAPIP